MTTLISYTGASQPSRVGRVKTLIAPGGELLLAVCTVVDEASDCAALQIVWSSETGEYRGACCLPESRVARLAPAFPVADVTAPVLCIGNPCVTSIAFRILIRFCHLFAAYAQQHECDDVCQLDFDRDPQLEQKCYAIFYFSVN